MSGLDLYRTQRELALLFVYAALLGFALGALYDLLRFLRVLCGERLTETERGSKNRFTAMLRFLADLVFTLATALSLILLCYYANDGQFRGPALWGTVGGFFVYMQTVGRLTAKGMETLAQWLKSVVRLMLCLMLRPILWVGHLTAKAVRLLFSVTLGGLIRKRRELRTRRITEGLIASANQGFGLMGSDGENSGGIVPKSVTRSHEPQKTGKN
jgi:hypothetical protein